MTHFCGTINGSRSEVSRCGTAKTGMTATVAGWRGAIVVEVYHSEVADGDGVEIKLIPWKGSGGSSRVLFRGKLDAREVSGA